MVKAYHLYHLCSCSICMQLDVLIVPKHILFLFEFLMVFFPPHRLPTAHSGFYICLPAIQICKMNCMLSCSKRVALMILYSSHCCVAQ